MLNSRRTTARGLSASLLLGLALAGCGGSSTTTAAPTSAPSSAPPSTAPAEAAPASSAPSASTGPSATASTTPPPAGCTSVDPPELAVCRLVTAIRTGDTGSLSAKEKAVARTVKGLPSGPFMQNQCELVGDVTASCTLTFTKATGDATATFTVVPVNATYNDGLLTTKNGEKLRYEVDSYGGLSTG